MNYLIFGIVIAIVVYYMARKYYLRLINEINFCDEKEQKEMENKLEEKNKIIQMQKEILFYISDGIHNFGNKMYIKNGNIEAKYFDDIRRFFAYSRWLSENLSKNLYSHEEYVEILNFIQKDFHDYFHHISKELDLKKYIALVQK
jgi:hypothetical protein